MALPGGHLRTAADAASRKHEIQTRGRSARTPLEESVEISRLLKSAIAHLLVWIAAFITLAVASVRLRKKVDPP